MKDFIKFLFKEKIITTGISYIIAVNIKEFFEVFLDNIIYPIGHDILFNKPFNNIHLEKTIKEFIQVVFVMYLAYLLSRSFKE